MNLDKISIAEVCFGLNPNFLLGVEGDIDGANITGTNSSCLDATHCASSDGKNSWFATLRGQLGYVQDNWLIFATGGAAWVHGSATRTITALPNSSSGRSASTLPLTQATQGPDNSGGKHRAHRRRLAS